MRDFWKSEKWSQSMFSQEGKSFMITDDAKSVRLHRERHNSTWMPEGLFHKFSLEPVVCLIYFLSIWLMGNTGKLCLLFPFCTSLGHTTKFHMGED